MCRLFAMTSRDYLSPISALQGLDAMREGYDGSGVGIFLKDLGGPFADIKDAPILSGIVTSNGLKRLDKYMLGLGFMTKYKISFRLTRRPPKGVPKRDIYLVRAYDYPSEWDEMDEDAKQNRLMQIRLTLKKMGEAENDIIIFSFWPDTVLIKEIGNPMDVALYLNLDRQELISRVVMVQGRQNTNYDINLYACHPFFLQGFATMTNGENTAFLPNREFLRSRGFPGYNGYMSDSEVFTHILHYTVKNLGLNLDAYKHIITPLRDHMLNDHPQAQLLRNLKQSCRRLIIDGPNCVIGCLPDNTLFMVQDRKKLRPGVVGGKKGLFAFSSEICGLEAVIPDRDCNKDFQPMHLDTVTIAPDCETVTVSCQTAPLQ